MAVGFPAKTTYANGDVFSASDINDTNGTINLLQTSTLSRSAGKNALINGGFDIWQRGTTSTTSGAYGADRWYQFLGTGSITWARESTTVPSGSQYCMKMTSGLLGSAAYIMQFIETNNAIGLAGKTVTFSTQVASSASTSWTLSVGYTTSTDSGGVGGWTDITATSGGTATTTTTTFTSLSGVFVIPSTAKSVRVYAYASGLALSTVGYIGQMQLELGSYATTFSRAGGTIQGELADCQRYFEKSYDQATALGTATTNGCINYALVSDGGSNALVTVLYKVVKRKATPNSITVYSSPTGTAGKISYSRNGAGGDVNGVTDQYGEYGFRAYASGIGAAWTAANITFQYFVDCEL
jgi:hypothetical protein